MPKLVKLLADDGGLMAYCHKPDTPDGAGLVLAHGAGSDAASPLLEAVADAFAGAGVQVWRINLIYRRLRPKGPPIPAMAVQDRDCIVAAARALQKIAGGPVFVGGHSYGGRQTTIAASETTDFADGLLLLSYPLHPPRRPDQLRTAHFPGLRTKSLFVHGARDPFGSPDELREAIGLIPAATRLVEVEGAGHELAKRGRMSAIGDTVLAAWREFFRIR